MPWNTSINTQNYAQRKDSLDSQRVHLQPAQVTDYIRGYSLSEHS